MLFQIGFQRGDPFGRGYRGQRPLKKGDKKMEKVYIHTEFIKLQQVLKLAGLIDQGSDVKYYLSQNMVYVNNELATERGKKIRHGDIVEVKGVGAVEVELDVD